MKVEKSTISLDNMRFYSYHGVLPQERTVGGDYSLSLKMECQVERSMTTDSVDDTVDYGQVAQLASQEMAEPSLLLERVAYRIAHRLLQNFAHISAVEVRLSKLAPPLQADCDSATVEIRCRR